METLFEYSFYAGLVLGLCSLLWLVVSLFRKPRRLVPPMFALMLAFVLLAGPALITRTMSVSLAKIERVVDGELTISLTGWDGESYAFLQTRPDVVVLQMANPDVTDDTVGLLRNMTRLRELDLNDSSITDVGLVVLGKLPSLQTLRIRATRITDSGFREHLMNSPTLKQLDLRQTDVAVETVDEWKSQDTSRRAFR